MALQPPQVQLPQVHLARDYPRTSLHHSWRKGELDRLRRGAYILPGKQSEDRDMVLARCVAVARSLRCQFAFSHQTAAILHGLPVRLDRPDVVYVTQRTRPSADRSADLVTHVTSNLPEADVTTVADLPVTTLDRTVLDCARSLPPRHAIMTVDGALRRVAKTTRFEHSVAGEAQARQEWLDQLGALGPVHNIARARAVIAHADGRAESPPESELRWLVLAEDFPAPTLQIAVRTDQGTYYPDLGWTGEPVRTKASAVVLEYDGALKYAGSEDLYAEKRREDALRRAGCHVLRVTKSELWRPAAFLDNLRTLVHDDPGKFPERRGLRSR